MRIALLGMEHVRTAMVRNLIEAGHEVTLHCRTEQAPADSAGATARVALTVADAVREAQVAVTLVPDDQAEDALTFGPGGLIQNLPPGAIHLCLSSISPEASLRLAAAHGGAGQGYVAAPMLGPLSDTASRRIWFLVAGPDPQVNRCLGVFEALGQGIHRIGTRPELAHSLKLGASALTAAMAEVLAEVLNYGDKAGLQSAEYLRILNASLLKSPLLDAIGGLMVRRDYEPSIQTVEQSCSDLGLLLQSSRALKLELPLAGPLLQRLRNAQALESGAKDLTILSKILRQAVHQEHPAVPDRAAAPGRRRGQERRRSATGRSAGEREQRKGLALAAAEPVPGAVAPVAAEPVPGAVAPVAAEPVPGAVAPVAAEPVPGAVAPVAAEPVPGAVAPVAAEPVPGAVAPVAAEPVPGAVAPAAAEPVPGAEPAVAAGPAPAAAMPVRAPDPAPPAAAQVRRPVGGGTYLAQDAGETLVLDLGRTSHFELQKDAVWAVVEGKPHRTFWRNFDDVEQALNQILFVRIRNRFLVNPTAVQDLRPLLWGRAEVSLDGGQQLRAGREAARKLKLMLG